MRGVGRRLGIPGDCARMLIGVNLERIERSGEAPGAEMARVILEAIAKSSVVAPATGINALNSASSSETAS